MQEQVSNPPARDDMEIDLMELFQVLWSKLSYLIVSLVLGAVAAGLFTKFLITPQYQAMSMIYIYSKTTSITSLTDLQIGSQLTVDFQIIATTREVVEDVIYQLNLDTTYEELCKNITIENPTSSRVLKLTVRNPDPRLAADISNALADRLRQQVADVMSTDKPSTVQRAVVPTKPSSPSMMKNVAIGGLACFAATAGIIIMLYLLDDTITNGDDVNRYLGLNTIAEIPLEHGQDNKKKKKRSSHKKHSSSGRHHTAAKSTG